MIHSAQIVDEFRLRIEGREFFLGVTSEHRVWHIETRDAQFGTPEGIRVGDAVAKALSVPGASFHQLPGCFAYVRLPSGWAAGFWPVTLDESKPGSGKFAYLEMNTIDAVPKTAVVGFVFKSIYVR
jgi:hypothetical protein